MYLKKLMKNAAMLLCSMAMMSAGGEAHGVEIQAREIPFESIDGVCVGNAQSNEGKTGVTVLCFPKGAKTGIDISGGGPASRETPVLDPTREDIGIHAIVLSGGSAYGLAAADGVMACLEENGIGLDTGFALVPLVVQSCIYDLSYGSATFRPEHVLTP